MNMKNSNLDLDFYGPDLNALDISLKNMYYFIIVAETGNMTKAAQRLYTAQSTVSKTILSIEEKLGTDLFIRQKRTVTLTKAGEYLYRIWRPLIKNFNTSVECSKSIEQCIAPKCTIGCFPLLDSHRFLQPFTDRIQSLFPNTEIELLRMNYIRLLEHLNAGNADLIFTLEMDLPDSLENYGYRKIGNSRMVAVVSADHPLANCGSISFSQLQGERIYFSEPSGVLSRQAKLEQMIKIYNFPLENIFYVNNDLTAYLRAEQGYGIAIGARDVYPAHNNRVCRVEIRDLEYAITALWRRDADAGILKIIHSILE